MKKAISIITSLALLLTSVCAVTAADIVADDTATTVILDEATG